MGADGRCLPVRQSAAHGKTAVVPHRGLDWLRCVGSWLQRQPAKGRGLANRPLSCLGCFCLVTKKSVSARVTTITATKKTLFSFATA